MTNKIQNLKLVSLRAQRSNLTVFKRSAAVLILFVLSVFLGAPIAYAENEKLRVYYSEPIGAGEKVYHLTACNWVRAYEPLVCSDETKGLSKNQCEYGEGDKKGDIKKGTKIMGCTTEGVYKDDEKMYLEASVSEYDKGGCKDDPTLQGYKYGPVWAIAYLEGAPGEEGKWMMQQKTVATKDANTKPSGEIIKGIYEDGDESNAYPFYKTNFCATWDLIPDKNNPTQTHADDTDKTGKQFTEAIKLIGDSAVTEGKNLIEKGCNNDNSKEALPIVTNNAASPVALVHCSLVERITGETGTDVFSQYVGALYKWAAGIVGIVTVLIMVFSGIQISMAGGDSAKIDSAKNRIMQSIIGLVILFLAGLILYTINPGFFTG